MKVRRKRKYTGSAVAQDNKVRGSGEGSPPESINMRDSAIQINKHGCSNSEQAIVLGHHMKIMSLNVEGISAAKSDMLARLLTKHSVDILNLQETHLSEDSPPSRYKIPGYEVVTRVDHRQYGIMTYARRGLHIEECAKTLTNDNIHTSKIKYQDVSIINVYKPPNVT